MTITAADLKFFASAYPLDTSYGGGRKAQTALQTGVENNTFEDIPPGFRGTGGLQMRKAFAHCVSANAEIAMGAQVLYTAPPTDSAVEMVLFAFGNEATTRAQAAVPLQRTPYYALVDQSYSVQTFNLTTKVIGLSMGGTSIPAGTLLGFQRGLFGSNGEVYPAKIDAVAHIVSTTVDSGMTLCTMSELPDGFGSTAAWRVAKLAPDTGAARCCGVAKTTATSGASSVAVDRVVSRVVPNITPYPSYVEGINPRQVDLFPIPYFQATIEGTGLAAVSGRVPIFRNGEAVLIAGGGNSEIAVVSFVDYRGSLTFAAALGHSYPTGSTVSSMASLGDLRATVGPSFAQQTWTRQWADSVIGNTIDANYNRAAGPIVVTNLGAITGDWAIIRTSPTEFRAIERTLGQVASGNASSTFAPLNPATNTPFFSIPPEGWGSGWSTGHVLRFPTFGAYAPFWQARCVSPSAAGVLTDAPLQFRASVNA